MLPASLAIIQSSFRPEDRPRAVGIWSGFTGVATLTAPFAAGWLLGLGTWRWIFVINVPVAAVLVLVALRHVPESRQAAPAPIDWAGSLLAVVALAAVTYVLMVTPGWRSAAAALITATAIAVGACAAFVWHERRSPAPMLPAAVFRSVPFITANLVVFFVYGEFGAFPLVFTIELETISGYSPLEAGSTILPVTIITLALSGPSGQLSARLGPRLQLSAGPVLCAAAALLAARVSTSSGYWTSVIPLECVFGLGIAATVPPMTSTMLCSIPGDHAGIASGMAAGKGCSGPGGTQGTAPGSRWPVPAGRPARRHCGPTRARNLRCAGTGIPGRRRYPGRQANGRAPRPRSPPSPPRHQDRMKAARGSEGGTALCQRRRGLADAGLPSVP